MRHQNIAILGGTGFVGRVLACELARERRRIRVLTRRRERDRALLVIPSLELVEVNVHSGAALSEALKGCDAVVNLVGILNSLKGPGETFEDAHATLAAKIADAARFNRIDRLVHMSALGASEDAPSEYLRTKAAGEAAVFAAAADGMKVTSFRPSVIFGPADSFINRFATLLRMSPVVFPLACPDARFAPVYVADVAKAFAQCLDDKAAVGASYELCGPNSYSLRELVEYTAKVLGLKRRVIGLGDGLSKLQAQLLELVPGKPFTMDNYHSLQIPSICSDNGFARLGITPRSLETIVPGYLRGDDREALYEHLRETAGRH